MELLKAIWNEIIESIESAKIVFNALRNVFITIFTDPVLLARFILLTSIVWFPILLFLIKLIVGGIKKCLKRK